jgi:hypothetical protein
VIDCEEDPVLRAVLVGMLREMERKIANAARRAGGLDARLDIPVRRTKRAAVLKRS